MIDDFPRPFYLSVAYIGLFVWSEFEQLKQYGCYGCLNIYIYLLLRVLPFFIYLFLITFFFASVSVVVPGIFINMCKCGCTLALTFPRAKSSAVLFYIPPALRWYRNMCNLCNDSFY